MESRNKRKRGKTYRRLVVNLTEDLIIEILLRLPVRSIGRFRSICKSWYDLLTHDIRFLNMKLNLDTRKGNFQVLFITSEESDFRFVKQKIKLISNESTVKIRYPFQEKYHDIEVLGSCNGLICAHTRRGSMAFVWNPCTKEYRIIPSWNKPIRFETNSHKIIGNGFGYDTKTGDYKFVLIFTKSLNMDVSGVKIYTLRSDSWKTFNSCIPYKLSSGECGVFLNGAVHWVADTFGSKNSESGVILSFDMEEEIFKEIALPDRMDDFDYKYVERLRGRLCMLCSVSKVNFEVWEMKEYGVRESWSKLFKTDQQQMMNISSYHYLRSAVSLDKGEILLHLRLYGIDFSNFSLLDRSAVVRISLEDTRRHHNRRKYRYNKYMVQMVPYMESLVSLNSGEYVEVNS